jgi:hypothetical protein
VVRFSVRQEFSVLPHKVQIGSGSRAAFCSKTPGPGLRRPGCEVDHLPRSSADVDNEWCYILLLCRISLSKLSINLKNIVAFKNTVSWYVTPCSLLELNRCFGGMLRLNNEESTFLKMLADFTMLYCVLSQKDVLYLI